MSTTKPRIDWGDVRRRLERNQAAIDSLVTEAAEPDVETLNRRAAELAARRQTSAPAESGEPLLVCALGNERYALALQAVREVLPSGRCTPVPGGPATLLGVINLRGKIHAVLSLRGLLQLPDAEPTGSEGGHVAMVQHGAGQVALHIGQAERIAMVLPDSFAPATADQRDAFGDHVRGVTAAGMIVLDVSRLLAGALHGGPFTTFVKERQTDE